MAYHVAAHACTVLTGEAACNAAERTRAGNVLAIAGLTAIGSEILSSPKHLQPKIHFRESTEISAPSVLLDDMP